MTKYAGRLLDFEIGATPSGVVGQVSAIGEAGSSRGLIDASAYGDDWMDYVVGQQDGDEMALTIIYDPVDGDHQDLIDTYDGGEPETFHLKLDEADFHVFFPALVTKLSRGAARDGVLSLNATLKILNPGVQDAASS